MARARAATKPGSTGGKKRQKRDVQRDSFDFRDLIYRPGLQELKGELLPSWQQIHVLDQKNEGACTGFGLAAVINYQNAGAGIKTRVSARMLFEMAKRYDQWDRRRHKPSYRTLCCPRDGADNPWSETAGSRFLPRGRIRCPDRPSQAPSSGVGQARRCVENGSARRRVGTSAKVVWGRMGDRLRERLSRKTCWVAPDQPARWASRASTAALGSFRDRR